MSALVRSVSAAGRPSSWGNQPPCCFSFFPPPTASTIHAAQAQFLFAYNAYAALGDYFAKRTEVACHVSKHAIKLKKKKKNPTHTVSCTLFVSPQVHAESWATLTFRSGNSSRWAPCCWPPSPVNPVRTPARSTIPWRFLDTPFQP